MGDQVMGTVVAAIIVGIALSYVLNRVFTARLFARRTRTTLSHAASAVMVTALWADGLVLIMALIAFSSHWLLVLAPWIVINYVLALAIAARWPRPRVR